MVSMQDRNKRFLFLRWNFSRKKIIHPAKILKYLHFSSVYNQLQTDYMCRKLTDLHILFFPNSNMLSFAPSHIKEVENVFYTSQSLTGRIIMIDLHQKIDATNAKIPDSYPQESNRRFHVPKYTFPPIQDN